MSISTIISNVGSLTQNPTTAQTAINNNFAAINTALASGHALTGQAPNQMLSNLDMNNNQILNLPAPATSTSPLRVIDGGSLTAGGSITVNNITNPPTVAWFNVTSYGAAGNGASDDTSAINSAIAAFNTATKGVLYFPAGTYKTTAALTAITANGIIRGDGPSNLTEQLTGAVGPATLINNTTTNASVFTINSQELMIRDLSIKNTAGSTPIAGSAGITVTSGTDYNFKVDMENLQINGFYICIDRQAGALWSMHNIGITDPVLYGMKIRNNVNGDAGDWSLTNSFFYTGVNNATTAIRIEGSGGGKIANVKINCNAGNTTNYTNGIDVEGLQATSDMCITNISIENFTGTGIIVNNWPNVTFSNIQFFNGGGIGQGINLINTSGAVIDNVIAAGFPNAVVLSNTTGVSITNVTGVITGVPTPSKSSVGVTSSSISTITGNAQQNLVQGLITMENRTSTIASLMNITLGTSFIAGGSPTAAGIFGIIGTANEFFTGSAQKDWITSVNGGGAWWLNFDTSPSHGGTGTNALKIAPITAGGPSLTIFSGGSSGAPATGWFQWGGEQRTTSATNYTNNTPTTIMSVPLVAGHTYSIEGYIPVTAGGTAGGVQVVLNASGGLTTTSVVVDSVARSNNVNVGQVQVTSLTTLSSAILGAATGFVEFHGTITVNAGGTLNIQTAQNTTNATTMTIGQGARIICHDMP